MDSAKKKISEYGDKIRNDSFTRVSIEELVHDYGKIALLITGKLKARNDKYTTFSNIRVFDNSGKKTPYVLTDHINFPNSILEKYVNFNYSTDTKKFFILCVPTTYNHYGIERWGLSLVTINDEIPIIRAPGVKYEWDNEIQRLLKLRDQYNTKI